MGPSNFSSSDEVDKIGDEVNGNLDELEEGGKWDAEAERENPTQWTPKAAIALHVDKCHCGHS